MLEIEHTELARLVVVAEIELAAQQYVAVLIAQDRNEHLVFELGRNRLPVDVEIVGVRGSLTVLEHVEPPLVVAAHDADVIRHDVEDVSHAVLGKHAAQRRVIVGVTELGIQRGVIDDVVAVCTVRSGFQVRREVAMTDT